MIYTCLVKYLNNEFLAKAHNSDEFLPLGRVDSALKLKLEKFFKEHEEGITALTSYDTEFLKYSVEEVK